MGVTPYKPIVGKALRAFPFINTIMDIKELENFNLADAVKFHDKLNPALWTEKGSLDPEVHDKLIDIAKDFTAYLGLGSLKIEDITISGSNAAYSYTPHSDLDLHVLVDFDKLPEDDVYRELFTAKKTLYNDNHEIKVNGVPVELYVQDSNQPHHSLGEYSILKKDWIKMPKKRRANFDQSATKAKYEKLGQLLELALKTRSIDRIDKVLDILKRYRKAGLEQTGEFGPENLAFKALRKQGLIKKLYDLKNDLRSEKLSLEDYDPNGPPPGPEFKPTMPKGTVRVDVSDVYDWYKLGQHISDMEGLGKHDFGKGPPSTILSFGDEDLEHKYIQALKRTGLDVTDIDPASHGRMPGQKVDPTYNVNETFDKPYKILKWEKGDYGDVDAIARLDDNTFLSIMFNKGFSQETKEEAWSVEFYRNNSQEVTGEGDQQRVFATVLSAIQTFIKKYKPNKVYFSASKEVEDGQKSQSRARLYDSLVQRYARAWGFKAFRADTGDKVIYELSRINKGVAEARTNPEQNPKPESGFKELASIAKTISDPENWAISMTVEPKLGINPQVGISEDTPKGIYFYPLNYALDKTRYGKLPWGDNYPYIQLFQYDRSGEMTKQTKVDNNKLKQALLQYCPEEVIQQAIDDPEYDGTPYWFIYDCLSRLGKSDETNVVRWNKVLRDLGFTSVFDKGDGWIAYNEPTQGVVLDPRIIKQQKTIANKQQSGLVTPAKIEQTIFDIMDMELAANRAWQAYDPNGSKLRAAAKEYAKKPEFKPYYGKPGTEEIFDKAEGWGRYGAGQLRQEAIEWFKEQKAQQKVDEAVGPQFVFHVTPTKNLNSIAKQGLVPTVGDRTSQIAGEKSGIYVFPDKVSAEDAVMNWLGDEFDDEPLTMLKIDVTGLENYITKGADYELIVGTTIDPKRIKKVNIQLEEASGYIPSEKQKNDPRFKTALTVDVKPDSIKKNAKAFNSKISRAGVPPQLNTNGKF